mmetsp:Transcript_38617/g.106337  ORF Transcript_38617/g.106337 Transcript_38617/m.106337 type:complete len:504 (-) Transcript_38617:60-1571(-)
MHGTGGHHEDNSEVNGFLAQPVPAEAVKKAESWQIAHAYVVPSNLSRLRDRGELCDLSVRVGGLTFAVHRVVLASGSEYFRCLLNNGMCESRTHEVIIEEVEPDVFEQVLSFLYSGEAAIKDRPAAVRLLAAAERFLMNDLAKITFQSLKQHATADDYAALYAEARELSLWDLGEFAFARCCEHFEEVSRTAAFRALPRTLVVEMLESDFLLVEDEESVVRSAVDWADEAARKQAPEDNIESGPTEAWPLLFGALRIRGLELSALPRLWPRLQHHCVDVATCRNLLEALSEGNGGTRKDGALRWWRRAARGDDAGVKGAVELFTFLTGHPERGRLCAALLQRASGQRGGVPGYPGTLCREVLNVAQRTFESQVVIQTAPRQPSQLQSEAVDGAACKSQLAIAEFLGHAAYHGQLALRVIRDTVVSCLVQLNSDDARAQLCALRHGLLRRWREAGSETKSDALQETLERLAEALGLELRHTSSPWLKQEMRQAIQELRLLPAIL